MIRLNDGPAVAKLRIMHKGPVEEFENIRIEYMTPQEAYACFALGTTFAPSEFAIGCA
jgi:hypothetical protein